MLSLARILMFALLAVFAAGSVVHATSTTAMAAKMALADGGSMDMAGCSGCDVDGNGDDSGLACDLVCTAPYVADLGTETPPGVPVAVAIAAPWAGDEFVGRTGPPDPYPPRTLI